jgi:hypothetical protein
MLAVEVAPLRDVRREVRLRRIAYRVGRHG